MCFFIVKLNISPDNFILYHCFYPTAHHHQVFSLNNSIFLHLRTIISDVFLKLCSSFRSDADCATWPGSEIQDQHQGPFPRIWPVSSRSRDRHHQRDAASLQVGCADLLSFDWLTWWSSNSGCLQGAIRMLLFQHLSFFFSFGLNKASEYPFYFPYISFTVMG